MKYLLIGFFICTYGYSFGKKDTVVTYYNYRMEEIKKKDYCTYYRKTFRISESTYGVLEYYRSGVLHMSGSYDIARGEKTGLFVYYSNKGVKIKEEFYVEDRKEGAFRTWYEDGTPELEGYYKDDMRSGNWKGWYVDGGKSYEGVYLNNEREGVWTYWHRDGEKISRTGNYSFGKEEGAWKSWFRSGSLDQEGVYKAGKREGNWVFYFESGAVSAKETYVNGEATLIEFWDESGNPVEPTDVLEKDPEFPGGEMAMTRFIQQNIYYPELSREMGEQGTIYIHFTVGADGKLYDIYVLKGVSALLDAESLRVVKKMPAWVPGFSHNRIIDIDYLIPIKFAIA